jgi:hypothetical protein
MIMIAAYHRADPVRPSLPGVAAGRVSLLPRLAYSYAGFLVSASAH